MSRDLYKDLSLSPVTSPDTQGLRFPIIRRSIDLQGHVHYRWELLDVSYVTLKVPLDPGCEDLPHDFPFCTDGMWEIEIDIMTGQITDWVDEDDNPDQASEDASAQDATLFLKVTDQGTYALLDKYHEIIAHRVGYVPNELIPGEYGDYIEMKIRKGRIENWAPTSLREFFPGPEGWGDEDEAIIE